MSKGAEGPCGRPAERKRTRDERRHHSAPPSLLLVAVVFASAGVGTGADAEEVLTAHIIPHSHCDPGWLSTFEGYYTSDVNRIISAATDQLLNDKNKRFVWAETSFFSRWYEDQPLERKKAFRRLVHEGRWEFIGGGWAQNDEAASDLMLVVNQMTTGHQYLLENFGVQPRIGWQIDPFGHSSITPSLFAAMGFDAMVINRIHHQKKLEYKAGRLMEFVWRGAALGPDSENGIFTHVLHTHYSAPKGFDWEEGAPQVNSMNVENRANQLTSELKRRAAAYRTRHLLVPFGDDFKFKNAANQFQNMEQLVKHVSENEARYGVRLRFSTLSEYFADASRWAQQHGVQFPLFMGDFFPYADNEDSYWTGYYTTRPFLKKLSREVEANMRSAEALYAIARGSVFANANAAPAGLIDPNTAASHWMQTFEQLRQARREASIFSHHDAITGTCRSHVANDYVARMNRALNTARGVVETYVGVFLTEDPGRPPRLTHARRVLDRSSKVHLIAVYNPLSWQRSEVVSLHVSSQHVYVAGPDGQAVSAQIDRHWARPQDGPPSANEYILRFFAQVPPLGAAVFRVYIRSASPSDGPSGLKAAVPSAATVYTPGGGEGAGVEMLRGGGDVHGVGSGNLDEGDRGAIALENDNYKVEINSRCLVEAITDKRTGRRVLVRQSLARYRTAKSGAYIFRPLRNPDPVAKSGGERCYVLRGHVADVVFGVTGDAGFEVNMLLPRGGKVLNAMALQQTLTVSVGLNEELVTRFETDLRNNREVDTHNGVEFVRRRALVSGKIAKNYWPSVYGARIAEGGNGGKGGTALSILNSHSVGCGSQNEGQIEFMVHRQLNQDDGRGLSEAVRDASRPEVRLWFKLGPPNEAKSMFELQQLRLNNPLHVLFTADPENAGTDGDLGPPILPRFAPLRVELPPYIHIMSFLVRDGTTDEVILRLRSLSNSAQSFTLPANGDGDQRFFEALDIGRLSRTTLTANYQRRKFENPFIFATSTETVDESTKSLGNLREIQASQNTEEEGVFLSKSALERSRKILSVAGPEFSVRPGEIATYNLVLTDTIGQKERDAWLEKLKKKYPSYEKQLNKPKAFSLTPPAHRNEAPQKPQRPPQRPSQRPPPPMPPAPPIPPVNPPHPEPPFMPPPIQTPPKPTVNDMKTESRGLRSDALADAEAAGVLPDGFEYGFVMGAVSFASLCFLFNLRIIGLACRGGDTKKRR